MSRIGKLPIIIPAGVTITVDANSVNVKGPKGELSQHLVHGVSVNVQSGQAVVTRKDDSKANKSNHGLMRSLLNNMVTGVTDGFSKQLEVNGVGYRVSLSGSTLNLSLGFSHEVKFPLPGGIQAKVEQNIITISGFDKQLVGQVAADIRELRKPEPYKGKGIRYIDEYILRKSGKSGKEK